MPTKSPSVIYRYQPLRPDAIDLIRTGRLWFSDPSRFNDPFDFLPSFNVQRTRFEQLIDQSREAARWTIFQRSSRSEFLRATEAEREQRLRSLREKLRVEQERFRKDFAKNFRVTCFSAAQDNFLMWSHYAASHTGVCFGIRPLQMNLGEKRALRWKIDYRDERIPFEHPKPYELALRKAKAWKYEKEWRVVMATGDLSSGNRPLPRMHSKPRSEPGYFLNLQWDAIESIRFGALVDRKKRSAILKILQAEERCHIQAIQMHLSVDKFALEEEFLQR